MFSRTKDGQPVVTAMSYQMHVGHEVSQHRRGDAERPDAVGDDVEHAEVEVPPDLGQGPAPPAGLGVRRPRGRGGHAPWPAAQPRGQQGSEGQGQQRLHQHEDAEDLEGAAQAQGLGHLLQQHGQPHGEQAGPRRHHPVGQAQPPPEVVPQDDQRGLEGEGGAAAEQDAVGEVTQRQRAGGAGPGEVGRGGKDAC